MLRSNAHQRTYESVQQIMDQVLDYHQDFLEQLQTVYGQITDPRTRYLLETILKSQADMHAALVNYEREGSRMILETMIQYIPDEETHQQLEEMELQADMEPDELLESSRKFQQALADFYAQLARQVSATEVKNFFETLHDHTEKMIAKESWRTLDSDLAPGRPQEF